MPRNMDRRIEFMFPIEDLEAKSRIRDEILSTYWEDNCKARELLTDGTYQIKTPGEEKPIRAQMKFIESAREQGIKSLPYEKAIRHGLKKKGRPIVKKFPTKNLLTLKGSIKD